MRDRFEHQFVQFIPDRPEEGVLYISIEYAIAVHNCFCGCGNKIVTPLSPTDWELTFDGETVSLYPSIGSWSLPCRSHYWIERNRIHPARQWTDKEIEKTRDRDASSKRDYYERRRRQRVGDPED